MRQPLLALLAAAPAHGYELKQELERRFDVALPAINAGQIYTALGRLERDGLVEAESVDQDGRPSKRVYRLTADGEQALERWLAEPTQVVRLRDEFLMKVVLARDVGIAEPGVLIERQRDACLQALRDLQALGQGVGTVAAELLLEGAALHVEADLKWLARCEELLIQEVGDGPGAADDRG